MKHAAGQPVKFSASTQNKIESIALNGLSGVAGVQEAAAGSRAVIIRVENLTGGDVERGDTLQLGDYVIDPDDDEQGAKDPTLEAVAPTWPDTFGRIAIAVEAIGDEDFGKAAIVGVTVARVFIAQTYHQFAAPDSGTPGRLRSSDTGEVRIIGNLPNTGERMVLVELSQNRPVLWQYERLEDYPDTDVKLLTLDGVTFSGSAVTLLDEYGYMDDQVEEDKGTCIQVGSRFYAIQANC